MSRRLPRDQGSAHPYAIATLWGLFSIPPSTLSTLGVCLGFVILMAFGLFKALDNGLWDMWTRLMPHRYSTDIVIIGISETTTQRYGRIGTWNREIYAIALRNLQDAGVKAIGIDVLFTEAANGDNKLAEELKKPNVILSATNNNVILRSSTGETKNIWKPLFSQASYGTAYVETSTNGIVREFKSLYPLGNTLAPSFTTQIARAAGYSVEANSDSKYIKYIGPPGQSFNYNQDTNDNYIKTIISFEDIVNGNFRYSLLQNKIALIGLVADGADRDQLLSPYLESGIVPLPKIKINGWNPLNWQMQSNNVVRMPGVEVLANVLSSQINMGFSQIPNWAVYILAAVLLFQALIRSFTYTEAILFSLALFLLSGVLHFYGVVLSVSTLMLSIPLGVTFRNYSELRRLEHRLGQRIEQLGAGEDLIATSRSRRETALHRLEVLERIEERLALERSQLHMLLSNLSQPLFLANAQGIVLVSNPAAAEFILAGQPLQHLNHLQIPGLDVGIEALLHQAKPLELLMPKGLLSLYPVKQKDNLKVIIGVITPTDQFSRILDEHEQITASIVHDLRSPLTSILGFAHFLEVSVGPDEQELLKIIQAEGLRMSGLIDSFLEASKLRSTVLELKELDLSGLLRRLATVCEPLYSEKQLQLSLQIAANLSIVADEKAINRIIINLLSNAAKYSDPKKQVWMRAYLDHNEVFIEIQDQGYGIPEKDLGRLFERFFRSQNPNSRKEKGTGLGLWTVRELIESHKGHISVQSTLNAGSTFTVRLPLDPQDVSDDLQLIA